MTTEAPSMLPRLRRTALLVAATALLLTPAPAVLAKTPETPETRSPGAEPPGGETPEPVPSPRPEQLKRFWSYHQFDGTGWIFVQQGPGDRNPRDGSVEGWRFSASENVMSAEPPSGETYPFETICAGVEPRPGMKRVGLVVDFGAAEDAFPGDAPPKPTKVVKCAVTGENATGMDLLASVVRPRIDREDYIVEINGYPAKEKDKGSAVQPQNLAPVVDAGGSSLTWILGGVGIVALLGVGAYAVARRGGGGSESKDHA
ncbi:SCO2322 family protein [Rhizohabitans arisaemae]|uniref:SCO2322 family protein n=1 Tax=Rhizohabitans arisaemae TaxID=2720610 RepID=UPI0024B1C8FF|nr:SCO2322 family protein [Rhizohabitans arisaemae]